MLKYTIIGDLHCREIWKDIVKKESDSDQFIFLGDYLTPREVVFDDPTDVCGFLYEILDFKDKESDRVVLLRGNHDLSNAGYYWAECTPYDRYSDEYMSRKDVKEWFLKNTQWVYRLPLSNIICSHAGIGQYFLNECLKKLNINEKCPSFMIDTFINELEPSELFGFNPGNMFDTTGDSETQPCTWIRPASLFKYGVEGIVQVVGHTPVKENIVNLKDRIWLCDALQQRQYLTITDNKFKINTI
jgi:hypothetical protein